MHKVLKAMNYPAYFQKTPAILQVVDTDGRIIDVSNEWLEVFGYQRPDVVGQPYSHFITAETHARVVHEYWPRLQAQQHQTELACDFIHCSGLPLAMLASVAVEHDSDSAAAYYLIALQAVQPSQQAEPHWLSTPQGVRSGGSEPLFRGLVSHLTTAFDTRFALVTECINPALTRVRTLAYTDQRNFLDNFEYELAGTPCAGVMTGTVVYHPEKLSSRFQMDLGEESYLGAPLLGAQGEIIGHLALLDDKPKFFNSGQIALVQSYALQAALALENTQLQRKVLQLAGWQEQGQLARQLHDAVTQSLFSVTLLTAGWQRLLRNGQPVDPDLWLSELSVVSQQALREVRLLTAELQPFVSEKMT